MLTAHPRQRNARPDPPWYRSGSRTGPPGCAQSPSWRARLRSGAGSPDCGVTAAGRALKGLDPGGPPPSPSRLQWQLAVPLCSPRPLPKASGRIPSLVVPTAGTLGVGLGATGWTGGDSRGGGEGNPRLSLDHGAISTQGTLPRELGEPPIALRVEGDLWDPTWILSVVTLPEARVFSLHLSACLPSSIHKVTSNTLILAASQRGWKALALPGRARSHPHPLDF